MGHGQTWITHFFPGYEQLNAYLQNTALGAKGLLFGNETVIVQHVIAAILVSLIILVVSIRARMQLAAAGADAIIPPPKASLRNFIEYIFEGLYGLSKNIIGPDAGRYFPVIAALAMFIFFSNILGLVPGFAPPTDNWNTTFACGGFVFLYYNYHGIRAHGMGHIAHMANPVGEPWGWFLMPLLFPIEIVSHVARPFSLGVRLAANMMGDHAVLAAFLGLVPLLVPLPFMALGLMVCMIQTLVFVLLTMIYIGLSVADTHNHDHEHEKDHAFTDTEQAELIA